MTNLYSKLEIIVILLGLAIVLVLEVNLVLQTYKHLLVMQEDHHLSCLKSQKLIGDLRLQIFIASKMKIYEELFSLELYCQSGLSIVPH